MGTYVKSTMQNIYVHNVELAICNVASFSTSYCVYVKSVILFEFFETNKR